MGIHKLVRIKNIHNATRSSNGFTIVELLIVIIVIGILAGLVIVTYSSIQKNANDARRMTDIRSVVKIIELYYADNGSYPFTGTATTAVLSDSNCGVGSRLAEWVPNVVPEYASKLPQSDGMRPYGYGSGCYKYWSNGSVYVVSAWVASQGGSKDSKMYRRVGFREQQYGASDQYYCNHPNIGGAIPAPYNENNDRYKLSFTISNVTSCNETPPAGA